MTRPGSGKAKSATKSQVPASMKESMSVALVRSTLGTMPLTIGGVNARFRRRR